MIDNWLSDKEVGELWEDSLDCYCGECRSRRDLIRKLVEESTAGDHARCPFDYHDELPCSKTYHRKLVLARFGIEPGEWEMILRGDRRTAQAGLEV